MRYAYYWYICKPIKTNNHYIFQMKYIKLFIAVSLSIATITSCGKEEPNKGSSWEDIWGDKDKDDDNILTDYERTVEQVQDDYNYPEGEPEEFYSPSLGARKYKPVIVKYYPGHAAAAGDLGKAWKTEKARIVHNMIGYEPETKTYEKYQTLTNRYGSTLTMPRQEATGRFYVKKIDGRWWIIDPEGYVHYERGVTSFRHGSSARNAAAFKERFSDDDQTWIDITRQELAETGIHSTGAFCTNAYVPMVNYNKSHGATPIIMCPSFGFLSKFKSAKNGGKWPGNDELIEACLVFHPDWPSWCREYIKGSEFDNYRFNKDCLGFFSDNEINFHYNVLQRALAIKDNNDIAKKAADDFLKSKNATAYTEALGREFAGLMAEKYYKAVREAVDAEAKGLMYVGTRLHGTPKYVQQVVEAAGRYCDIVSINYYSRWSPELTTWVKNWGEWANKPFMVTEFYTKGVLDSDLPNTSGAGWCVPTQTERAYAYQHFTLGLLEAKNCVGWTWFKYQDDDGTDNSGMPANKGLYDNSYKMFPTLGKFMREINFNVYDLINYFDGKLK